MSASRKASFAGALLAVLTSLAACGGDTTSPAATRPLTTAQAQAVAANLFTELSQTMVGATTSATITGGRTIAPFSALALLPGATTTITHNCANGGTIAGSYAITTNLDAAGTGTAMGTLTVTADGCRVSDGTELIATNGTLTSTYSAAFTAFQPSSVFTWHTSGNISYGASNCAIDYTVDVNLSTGHETITGTLCGQTLNYSA